jgi:CheY-like chemotaxis protein
MTGRGQVDSETEIRLPRTTEESARERLRAPEPRATYTEVVVVSERGVTEPGLEAVLVASGWVPVPVRPGELRRWLRRSLDAPSLIVLDLDVADARVTAAVRDAEAAFGALVPPVILVTADEDESRLAGAFRSGVKDVLSRPAPTALLRVKLSHWVKPRSRPVELGGMTVDRTLGRGGMSVVYRATTREGASVALKVVDDGAAAQDPELLARFVREAETLATLGGDGAPALHGSGREGRFYYLAMALLEGEPLDARLARAPLDDAEVEALLAKLARALESMHARGIIHRDVKPANVIVAPDGTPRLIDFGLAKPIEEPAPGKKAILGTPAYVSPEVARGAGATPASDAFSLGMTALTAALGRTPVEGTPFRILCDLAQDVVPDARKLLAGRSPALVTKLAGLLEPRPEHRMTLASLA